MRGEVVPEHNMEEAENTGVNESVARVAVDEAITQEQGHRLAYRVPADDLLYRLERIARLEDRLGGTRVPDTKSFAYIAQHLSVCVHPYTPLLFGGSLAARRCLK